MRKKVYFAGIIVLILTMNYKKIGELTHEIFGLIFVLFCLIHAFKRGKKIANLNGLKFANFSKFCLNLAKISLNLTLVATLLISFVSAVFLSEYIFAFVDFGFGSDKAKNLHMFATHLLFLCVSIHIGLNFKIFAKSINVKFGKLIKFALFIVVCAFGIYSFLDLHFYEYLFFKIGFGLENKNSLFLSICEYLSIFCAIVLAVRFLNFR